ncbi:C2H2-type domain-containing protein [Fusarium sp. Ph1]|nr:C2H2-type domain-containing protein [Fusarium sp. Ph1]
MSDPIDIPLKRSRLGGAAHGTRPFPEDEGPYMGYIEIFQNGHIYQAVSSGSGKYITVGSRCDMPALAFIVEKNRVTKTTTIAVHGRDLKRAIARAIPEVKVKPFELALDFNTVVKHYADLKAEAAYLSMWEPYNDTTKEMELLVNDLLLERALYDGLDLASLREEGILSSTHIHAIRERCIDLGLADLEICHRIGQSSEHQKEEYLKSQNYRIYQLAMEGNLGDLVAFCEPLLRSREIEVFFNSDLLRQLLDKDFFDIYQYLLDLIDRTRPTAVDVPDPDYPDITYDPFCVAIRLGHYPTVQAMVVEETTFEGYIADDLEAGVDRVLTPLLAAVLWNRSDMIQMFKQSPIYCGRMTQAVHLAAEVGLPTIMQTLSETPQMKAGYGPMVNRYPPQSLSERLLELPQQDLSWINSSPVPLSPIGDASLSSISYAAYSWGLEVQPPWEGFASITAIDSPAMASVSVFTPATYSSLPTPVEEVMNPLSAFSPVLPSPTGLCVSTLASPHSFGQMDKPLPISARPRDVPLFIGHTKSYRKRHKSGRASLVRLERRCQIVGSVCGNCINQHEYLEISSQCTDTHSAWKLGLESLRKIMNNLAPCGLAETLASLLVADALVCQISQEEGLISQFVADLWRWKSGLTQVEMALFDKIACAAWNIDTIPISISNTHKPGFGNMIRELVSCKTLEPTRSVSRGIRLESIQRQMKTHERHPRRLKRIQENSTPQSVEDLQDDRPQSPELEGFWKTSIRIEDFFDAPAYHKDSILPESSDRKPVHASVAILLESVAFTVFLAAASSTQHTLEDDQPQSVASPLSVDNQSRAMVEEFLSLKSEDEFSYDSGIGMDSPVKNSVSRYILEMRKASEKRTRLPSMTPMTSNLASLAGFRSPTNSAMAITSSISGAPPAMTAATTVLLPAETLDSLGLGETPDDLDFQGLGFLDFQDPEFLAVDPQAFGSYELDFQAQTQEPRSQETQHLESPLPVSDSSAAMTPPTTTTTTKRKPSCPQCEKTFSSVSNRNKHIREGCRFGEKSTYPCSYQTLGCTKSLSSYWYRQRHEEDRCKYNPSRARR